ncbi:MAG: hypothetical protein IKE69_09880 [Thermoguttaceae bacterium]|nr:hypothetical protein [Thermoguttaceae bacterium]
MTHRVPSLARPRSVRRAFVLLALVLSAAAPLSAQSPETPAVNGAASGQEIEPLAEMVQNFFEQISNPAEGTKSGLETLLKNSPFEGNAKDDMIKTLAEKIDGISPQFGGYVSFEPIGVKRIGRDLIVLRYLYKCQNYPLVWYFIFYRPTPSENETAGKNWRVIHLYYDSQLNIPLWESGF